MLSKSVIGIKETPIMEIANFGRAYSKEIGISTVVCGPGSIQQAHKIDEFIELNELKKCLKFLDGLKKQSTLN